MLNKKVERIAADILTEMGIGSELPIPVDKVAKRRGLEIRPYDLGENVSGVLVIESGKGTIGVNPHESKVRQRFTIAHELGHFELHKNDSELFIDKGYKVLYRDENSSKGEVKMEQEANAFAAALLMPEKHLRAKIGDLDLDLHDEDSMKVLAKLFDVSVPAMTFRIANLNLIWKL